VKEDGTSRRELTVALTDIKSVCISIRK